MDRRDGGRGEVAVFWRRADSAVIDGRVQSSPLSPQPSSAATTGFALLRSGNIGDPPHPFLHPSICWALDDTHEWKKTHTLFFVFLLLFCPSHPMRTNNHPSELQAIWGWSGNGLGTVWENVKWRMPLVCGKNRPTLFTQKNRVVVPGAPRRSPEPT